MGNVRSGVFEAWSWPRLQQCGLLFFNVALTSPFASWKCNAELSECTLNKVKPQLICQLLKKYSFHKVFTAQQSSSIICYHSWLSFGFSYQCLGVCLNLLVIFKILKQQFSKKLIPPFYFSPQIWIKAECGSCLDLSQRLRQCAIVTNINKKTSAVLVVPFSLQTRLNWPGAKPQKSLLFPGRYIFSHDACVSVTQNCKTSAH